MSPDKYVQWAFAHPIGSVIATVIAFYLVTNLARIIILIPGALEELTERRQAKRIKSRDTFKGPWS